MNRRHLVLIAAGLFAVAALVRVFQSHEPAPAPVAAPKPAAAPEADVSAPPAGRVEAVPLARVYGEVTNARGDRVPGVRVTVQGGRAEDSVSDATGAYELRLELLANELPTLRFAADGYEHAVAALAPTSIEGESARLDVRLEPAAGAVVSGTLTSERGSAISGETIHLESAAANIHHAAVSAPDGSFFLPGVEPHPGYYLSVRPKSGYGDYQRSLDIDENGLSLEIALKALSTARLRGRVVDPEGHPIPNLTFTVVSGQALGMPLPAKSDERGYFVVNDVPTGNLSFLASAPERLVISGARLAPGSDGDVLLRADWGDGNLVGRVVEDGGRPLAGAEVELSWSHLTDGVSGRSNRSALTAANGSFEFRHLGAGIHHLEVRAPGHREVQLETEVAAEAPGIEVQLEKMREAG